MVRMYFQRRGNTISVCCAAIAVFMEEAFKAADVGYIAHALGVELTAKAHA